MFSITVTEVKGPGERILLLEQTLDKLNLRAVIDALNPPTRRHRAKEGGPGPSHVKARKEREQP